MTLKQQPLSGSRLRGASHLDPPKATVNLSPALGENQNWKMV